MAGWSEVDRLWHFLGIDNAFYYGVLCPAVFAAAGMPPGVLAGLVVNEFYTLDGLKFSTSRRHAVWAEDFLGTEDPALVRLYLGWDRPAGFESDFTEAGYAAFRDWAGPAAGRNGPRPRWRRGWRPASWPGRHRRCGWRLSTRRWPPAAYSVRSAVRPRPRPGRCSPP